MSRRTRSAEFAALDLIIAGHSIEIDEELDLDLQERIEEHYAARMAGDFEPEEEDDDLSDDPDNEDEDDDEEMAQMAPPRRPWPRASVGGTWGGGAQTRSAA